MSSDGADERLRYYRAAIREKFGKIQFIGFPSLQDSSDAAIESLFVAAKVSRNRILPAENASRWEDRVDIVNALARFNRVIALGDPGGGKSTLISWLAWRLCSGLSAPLENDLHRCIPVPLVLREIKNLDQVKRLRELIDLFTQTATGQQLFQHRDFIDVLLRQGRVLLLVDGLDEIDVEARRAVRLALIDAVRRYPDIRMLCTSRIVGYEECPLHQSDQLGDLIYSEEQRFLSEQLRHRTDNQLRNFPAFARGLPTLQGETLCHLVYVSPFDDRQIQTFAENWYQLRLGRKDDAEEGARLFVAAIQKNPATKILARTPNLLTLMALVYRVRLKLPDGRALLYEDIAQAYLQTIDQARGLRGLHDEFPWREKRRWLGRVAFEMQYERSKSSEDGDSSSTGVLASEEMVLAWLEAAIRESGYLGGTDVPTFAAAYLDWLSQRSGLLVPKGKVENVERYAFLHLSFQEFFAAVYLADQIRDPDWIGSQFEDDLLDALSSFDNRASLDQLRGYVTLNTWHETFIFCFELLGAEPRWAGRLVELLFLKSPRARRAEALKLLCKVATNSHTGIPSSQRLTSWNFAAEILAPKVTNEIGNFFSEEEVCERECLGILLGDNQSSETAWSAIERLFPRCLDLQNVELQDIGELGKRGGFNSLESLAFSATPSSALISLKEHPHLAVLALGESQVINWSQISALSRLRILSFRTPHRDLDLEAIGLLRELTELDIPDAIAKDWSFLSSLENLETIRCIAKNSAFEFLKNCKLVDISLIGSTRNNPNEDEQEVFEFSEIRRHFASLERLSLDAVFADNESWSVLGEAANLTSLWLVSGRIATLEFLQGMPALERLTVSAGNVLDVLQDLWQTAESRSSVKNLTIATDQLDMVVVRGYFWEVSDLSLYNCKLLNERALLEMPKLKRLYMRSVDIDLELVRALEKKGVDVDGDELWVEVEDSAADGDFFE